MKVANGYEFVAMLEQIAPKKLAMEGDPIGLEVGDLSKKVRKIMFALDVLETVVDEAIEKNVDMIIAHHPLLFRPVSKIDMTTAHGRMLRKLIKHDIIVYAAHTNLDIADGGVNDLLAELLELENTEVIVPTYHEDYAKIAVYVPEESHEAVRLALANNGAGEIGLGYEHCSFTVSGTGRFKPNKNANPSIGKALELTEVKEVKIEAVFPFSKKDQLIKAVKLVHPYEEPAIDVYKLENMSKTTGLGRVGQLKKEITADAFIDIVKNALALEYVRYIGDTSKTIQKVAVIGGDGNKFIYYVKHSGADIFITGDVYYHTAHDLLALDLPTIDAGHNIEKIMKGYLKKCFVARCKALDYEVDLIVSEINTDPFQFL
ncbi:Nif3-like dinuclear metal center hexameric protein [Listeria sp. PSOL-1]|uniref:Nif3-like dinuclear metal center hexameric protein n=1 Tax=Listeria sp. PSOL-1 TaxID=1844999 RepID=UPI0013D1BAF6|nr:Nif3-like dinuclear metal center hexameric protein [Listeria sp. PSOL-1]